jgi:DNA-directed RNA polymerase subunit omega
MARVTVEDCLAHIPNHFDLCVVAAKRARQLARGAPSKLPWGDHKSTVLTLREIGAGLVGREVLDESELPFAKATDNDMILPDLGSDI